MLDAIGASCAARDIPIGCCNGGCGVCKVRVTAGSYVTRKMSRAVCGEEEEASGCVLACKLYPRSDLTIEVVGQDGSRHRRPEKYVVQLRIQATTQIAINLERRLKWHSLAYCGPDTWQSACSRWTPALKHYKDVLGLIETGARRQGPRLPQSMGRARPPQRGPARGRRGGHGLHGLEGRFPGDAEEARRRHREIRPGDRHGVDCRGRAREDRRALPLHDPDRARDGAVCAEGLRRQRLRHRRAERQSRPLARRPDTASRRRASTTACSTATTSTAR